MFFDIFLRFGLCSLPNFFSYFSNHLEIWFIAAKDVFERIMNCKINQREIFMERPLMFILFFP